MKSNNKLYKIVKLAGLSLVGLFLSVYLVSIALAETTVTVEDCVIKVTVNIAIRD